MSRRRTIPPALTSCLAVPTSPGRLPSTWPVRVSWFVRLHAAAPGARRHRPPHHSCRKPGVTLVPLSHPHLASSRQNLSTCLPVPASWMTVMASGGSPQRPWQEVGLTPPRLFHTLPWPCCPFHFSLQFQAHWFARQPGHRRQVFMVINSSADRNKLSLWNAFQISRARYSCLQTGATARPTVFGWACGLQSCGLGAP